MKRSDFRSVISAAPRVQRSRRGGRLVTVLLMAFVVVGAGTRAAATAPVSAAELVSRTEQTGDAPDLAEYEGTFKVTRGAALEQLADVSQIADLQDELTSKLGDTFSGVWIDHEPYAVVVAVTSVTPDLLSAIDAHKLSSKPEIRVVPFTLTQLESVADAVQKSSVAHNSYIDVRANQVVVEVLSAADFAEAEPTFAAAYGSQAKVNEVRSLGGPAVDMLGGLGGSDHDWWGCPSGFTVYDLGNHSRLGFVTAAHCGNDLSYQGVTLPFIREHFGGNTDAQFHTAPGFTVRPRFIVNQAQNWRTLQDRKNEVVGQQVCKYGPRTYYSCGTVDTITFRPSYVPNANASFVRAYNCNKISPTKVIVVDPSSTTTAHTESCQAGKVRHATSSDPRCSSTPSSGILPTTLPSRC